MSAVLLPPDIMTEPSYIFFGNPPRAEKEGCSASCGGTYAYSNPVRGGGGGPIIAWQSRLYSSVATYKNLRMKEVRS